MVKAPNRRFTHGRRGLRAGSIDNTVRLWDIRRLKSGGESVCCFEHGKGVTSSYFSPSGAAAVSTSFDDTVRVFDVRGRREVRRVDHNNQTGRWLTPFRACFDPKADFAVAGA